MRTFWQETVMESLGWTGMGLAAVAGLALLMPGVRRPAAAATVGATGAVGAAVAIPAVIEAVEAASTVRGWVDEWAGREQQPAE